MSSIKCPICATVQPEEVDFCVYCNTAFDKSTITRIDDSKIKLTFLGTSHGHAEIGRFCSSTYFEYKGNGFVIDVGAPMEYVLKNNGIDENSIRAYFITHMHSDHVGGLTSLLGIYLGWKRTGEADIYFAEQSAIEPYREWMKAMHFKQDDKRLRFYGITPGVLYKQHGITVTAIPTEHISKEVQTYAFMIETDNGKRILFTGDLSHSFHDFPQIAKEVEFDLIVSEFTHLSAEKVYEVLKDSKTKCMIFSHVHPKNVALARQNNIKFDFSHIIATDGFVYEV